jgi:hypothetical protein
VLINEAYIGRTVYRKTKRVRVRSFGNRPQTRVIEQPRADQIEIPDATPPIVDAPLWQRVQDILNDPERVSRRPVALEHYELTGRLRCGICSGAMVGQTLRKQPYQYRYYRCRHVYDRNTGRDCTGRYVRAEVLEEHLWREIKRVLATPDLVLQEQRAAAVRGDDPASREEAESVLASLRQREERLVRLFGYGEVDEATIRAELTEVRRQQGLAANRLDAVRPLVSQASELDEGALRTACATVAKRLDDAGPEERERVLEALQVTVTATREEGTVEGVLPIEAPDFLINHLSLLPLNEHRHDDALVRKRMRAFSGGARALTPSNELVRGQPRATAASHTLVAPKFMHHWGACRGIDRRHFRFGLPRESP